MSLSSSSACCICQDLQVLEHARATSSQMAHRRVRCGEGKEDFGGGEEEGARSSVVAGMATRTRRGEEEEAGRGESEAREGGERAQEGGVREEHQEDMEWVGCAVSVRAEDRIQPTAILSACAAGGEDIEQLGPEGRSDIPQV